MSAPRPGTCGHDLQAPIDPRCPVCLQRAQARNRKQRSRGIGSGPTDPVPGLAGVTRQQIRELVKAIDNTRKALKELKVYIRHCKQAKIVPSSFVQLAEVALTADLAVLEQLKTLFEERTAHSYPPIL